MPIPTQITPNLDYPNNEPADLVAENVRPSEAAAIEAPAGTKLARDGKRHSSKSPGPSPKIDNPKTIEEQENEDLEEDEGLAEEMPERPGNVPRF